jgi:sporulation protein YabP
MDEKKVEINDGHTMTIDNRERMTLTGVVDVASFDESRILVATRLGELLIKGEGMKINKLNLESSQLVLKGKITACEYNDKIATDAKGILSRIFG